MEILITWYHILLQSSAVSLASLAVLRFLFRTRRDIHIHFYRCTIHFEIYVVHTPTDALFINLVKSFKFALKYTIISLLHVSVFNDYYHIANCLFAYFCNQYLCLFILCINLKTYLSIPGMLPHHLIYIKRRNFTECFNINITLVRYR